MVFVVLFGVQTYPVGQTTDEVAAFGTQVYPVGHRTAVPVFVLSVAASTVVGALDRMKMTAKMATNVAEASGLIEVVVDFMMILRITKKPV
jgi:hypothetical protein